MSLQAFKNQFKKNEFIHLNNSGRTPIPETTSSLMKHWLDRFHTEGAHCEVEMWSEALKARTELAKLVKCDPSQVAFFQNAASGISQVALGTKFQSGDEIIVWDQEYPSNFYPWRIAAERSGAKLVLAKSDNWQTPVGRILDLVTPKTKAIAISWVQFQTGAVTDLRALSTAVKGKNILLLADVIQGLGVRPLEFAECGFDFICGGSHKWLISPLSLGFLIGKPESLQKLELITGGAKTYEAPDTAPSLNAPFRAGSLRFEPGSLPTLLMIGFAESLRLINRTTVEVIESEANRLAKLLRSNLEKAGFETVPSSGSIVTAAVNTEQQMREVETHLKQKKITYGKRGPGLRFSTHAFNNDSDVRIF